MIVTSQKLTIWSQEVTIRPDSYLLQNVLKTIVAIINNKYLFMQNCMAINAWYKQCRCMMTIEVEL